MPTSSARYATPSSEASILCSATAPCSCCCARDSDTACLPLKSIRPAAVFQSILSIVLLLRCCLDRAHGRLEFFLDPLKEFVLLGKRVELRALLGLRDQCPDVVRQCAVP